MHVHVTPLARPAPRIPQAPQLGHCPVCGGSRLRTDEVADRELLQLTACLRCDHRWTRTLRLRLSALPAPELRSAA